MVVSRFVFQLVLLNNEDKIIKHLGTTFCVGLPGIFLTCRHVVDINIKENEELAIRSEEGKIVAKNIKTEILNDYPIDLALIRLNADVTEGSYFPILTPGLLRVGEDVYSYGFYSIEKPVNNLTSAFFRGNIVTFSTDKNRRNEIILPYPIIEGMSGSPVLTNYNGPKLAGICMGSQSQRIIAQEIVEFSDKDKEYKETINRIVEFGIAYNHFEIITFLGKLMVKNIKIESKRLAIPMLE